MNTSLAWIKALVPGLSVTEQEYMDAMTLSGSKVEGYKKLDADLDKIVIGQKMCIRDRNIFLVFIYKFVSRTHDLTTVREFFKSVCTPA